MNRRSGPSPNRVERQLARSVEAVERATGERPAPAAEGEPRDGRPGWVVEGEGFAYARGDGARWATDSPGTLAFWIMRDATRESAAAWELRTRGAVRRAEGVRDRWAELLGAADPAWRERHLAWLDAADRSGDADWPTAAAVTALIERLAARLSADAGQPHGLLPGTRPREDAQPWVEVHGDELRYRVRVDGRDLRDDRTTDVGDLLFWVFEPVTREMARAGAHGDWRGRWLELMVLVNPGWRGRVEEYL